MLQSMYNDLPSWITNHCEFSHHGEPFLWSGSGEDEIDIAFIKFINLTKDISIALEVVYFIHASVEDSKKRLRVQDYDK